MPERIKTYLMWFLVLVYFCGTIGFAVNPDFFKPFTPYTLIFTSFVFLLYQPWQNITYSSAFAVTLLFGYAAEAIGIKTGWIFGDYYYGDSLGYKLLGVPLVISLNWALLIACGVLVSTSLTKNKVLASLISAATITALDVLIEQVCAKMDFWYFNSGIAGIHNYIGWFLISFLFSFLFFKSFSKGNKRIALQIICLQIFFFGLTYILNLY
jgi:putative membrane protein